MEFPIGRLLLDISSMYCPKMTLVGGVTKKFYLNNWTPFPALFTTEYKGPYVVATYSTQTEVTP